MIKRLYKAHPQFLGLLVFMGLLAIISPFNNIGIREGMTITQVKGYVGGLSFWLSMSMMFNVMLFMDCTWGNEKEEGK